MGICRHVRGSDSLIRHGPACARNSKAAEVERPQTGTAVARRRGEALRAFFPKLSIWLNHPIEFARMRDVERYLAEATDLAELERRIARIARDAGRH